MSPRLCCGCCSGGTGTQIIAILSILLAMGILGNEIYTLLFLAAHPVGKYYWLPPQPPSTPPGDEAWIRTHGGVTAIHVGILQVALLQLVLSGVLLDGAHTARASRCKPWLYFNGCLFPVYLTIIIVTATEWGVPYAWYLLIPLAFHAYMLLVVWMHVRELRDPTWTPMAGWGLGGVIRSASQALTARMRSCWARARSHPPRSEPLGGPHDAVEI